VAGSNNTVLREGLAIEIVLDNRNLWMLAISMENGPVDDYFITIVKWIAVS